MARSSKALAASEDSPKENRRQQTPVSLKLINGERGRTVWGLVYDENIKVPHWMRYAPAWSDSGEPVEVTEQQLRWGALVSYLSSVGVVGALSPLHDMDLYSYMYVSEWMDKHIDPKTGKLPPDFKGLVPEVGKPKKAHYHLLLKFKGPVSGAYLSELLSPVVTVPGWQWEKVPNPDGALRYLCHLDALQIPGQPPKHRYDPAQVVGFGGMDLSPLWRVEQGTKEDAYESITAAIRDGVILTYQDAVAWATDKPYTVKSVLRGNVNYWRSIFSDVGRYRMMANGSYRLDPETGELIKNESSEN